MTSLSIPVLGIYPTFVPDDELMGSFCIEYSQYRVLALFDIGKIGEVSDLKIGSRQ